MMSARLESLKESLRKIAPTALLAPANSDTAKASSTGTGLAALDAKLESGGIPIGGLTEIAGAASSGKTAVALQLCAEVTKRERGRNLCAVIDGRGEFFPPSAAAIGVDLTRLLWVRPGRRITEVARATEILIRSRAFALLVIDLPHGSRLARSLAQRLRTSASQTSTSIVALCDRAGDVEQAQVRIQSTPKTLLIHKGSLTGGPQTVTIDHQRRRARVHPAAPIADVIDRVAPGNEPPGARIPVKPEFSLPMQGAF